MTHVHYKFSSKLSYDTVVFDGPHVTLRDLKRQIMGREKLRAGDCDLQITNAQTKEEYTDDEGLIPKGSSVIVRRIPIIGGKSSSNSKTRNIERSDVHHHHAFGAAKAMDDQSSSRALPFFSKMANLADADASEEDKIKVMINQSTYDSMNYNKKFGTVLPANYTCYRCGNTGHHIRNCPTSGQDKNFEAPMRIKKSTGIPRSFMVEVDDPSIKGAMLTNCGRYAIPAIDAEAYAIGKKEKPPFLPQEQPKSEIEKDPVPQELLCLICHDLSSDAVVIPCCGNSYCDDCIRTALLDSEDHVCPTCGQSDVSPDTLIANKFLRQAVNTFKKEQGHTKSLSGGCGTSQSQNPSPTPSPVPTPPPPTMQIQPPKLHQSSQQDPLLSRSQAADTPPQAPTTATGPASASAEPSTSLQPVQSYLETSDKEAKEKTHDDSAAADPCVLVSHKEPTAAPSQLIPLVNQSPAVEQPPAVSVNPQQSSSGPAPRQPGPSTSRDSSSSSSGCPTGGWNKSNTLQLPPSSSSSLYPATPPPLFPSPHFHTFLATQQPCNSYPHGYPPTTPVWTLPTPQGAPIPSLCSTTTTSSIPTLIPKEWYMHQRKTKERSPQRGSTHRRSSSRSNSKSYKAKSSRSYSRSSSRSRSRSRSRSQGRSRPHSPYSRHRDLHTRSHSSHYSYGYKRSRSPTPSSSSSPRVGYHSRSKSPMDRRKNSHHSRHHSKKSASSSCNSRRRREDPKREAGGPEGNLDSYLYAQRANQTSSLELDRERYLQWKKEYKEWCDKYFSSYVGHFNQLPPPLLNLPPPPLHPQWGDKEGSRNLSQDNLESRKGLQGRRSARMDGRSPPSQSSSDSRSPPSQSSSDSRSTPSQSSSDSRSSPSHSSNDSRSPPSQSSSDGRSSPSKDGAQPTTYQQRCAEKYSRPPITKGGKEVELQVRSKDNKQLITKNFENISTLKHEQNSMKKQQEGRGEDSSSPDAADSTDDCRNDKRRHNTGPNARKDGIPERDEATASDALESVRPLVKPDKRLDKDYERRSRGQRNLEMEKGWRRGKHSDSRQDMERQHKEKPSKGAGRVDTDRYRNPGGSKDSDSRSEKNRKRKGEDMERSSVKAQSSKCLKTKIPEVTETHKSESLFPFDRKKQNTEIKKERKTWPLTEKDIWEGGIKVKPQKKISINIKLDGKRTEDKTEKQDLSYLESITGKTKDETEKIGNGEEKLHRGETEIEVNEKKDSVFEEKIKPDEGEARQLWEKATFRDDKGGMRETNTGEKMENRQDFDLWHCAIRGVEEEKKESKKQSKGEEVTNDENMRGGKEEEWMMRKELVAGTQKERAEGESTRRENRGNPPREPKPKKELMEGKKWRMRNEEDATVDDGSSNYEDDQVRKTVGKTLEEITQERAADGENELVFIQVPRSIWEKEESEEEQGKRAIKVQKDALAVFLPSPSMSVTAETSAGRDTEGEIEQMTQRSVEMERDRARAMVRGRDREREKNSILSSSHRSVAPSSGKDRHDSNSCPGRDGERERRMETERPRDRERGRESERQSYRQKENKRLTERTRDEEKGRERGHSSVASGQKRNTPSSSQSYTYLTSHDTERRDRQREGDPGKSKSSSCPSGKFSSGRKWESSATSRATGLPDQNAHKTLLDSAFKDKDHPQYYHSHQSHAGTHHSPLPLSHSRGKERDPLPSESPGGSQRGSELGQPRMSSPGVELMQNRSRNESKVERGEWERNKVDKVIKEGIWERKNQKMVAEREGSYLWEDEADHLDGPTKWEGGRELEEGERPSSRSNSVSSSASQEGNMDDRRNEWKKKQKKHKTESRQPVPELLEEGELKKHRHKKKSKKERDGGEEESDGEADAKLCQVMLS